MWSEQRKKQSLQNVASVRRPSFMQARMERFQSFGSKLDLKSLNMSQSNTPKDHSRSTISNFRENKAHGNEFNKRL